MQELKKKWRNPIWKIALLHWLNSQNGMDLIEYSWRRFWILCSVASWVCTLTKTLYLNICFLISLITLILIEDEADNKRLVKSLIPRDKVQEMMAIKILGYLGHSPLKFAIQVRLSHPHMLYMHWYISERSLIATGYVTQCVAFSTKRHFFFDGLW